MSDEVDVYAEEWLPSQARERITELETEVALLRNQEALKNIAVGEVKDLRHALNEERTKVAKLRDALDGMSLDMSLMEERIEELSGRHGVVPDYPDNE